MAHAGPAEQRILVLAPTGRDATLACELLSGAGLAAVPCRDAAALCQQLEAGAGAVLLTEEALSPLALDQLSQVLSRQPPWSDLPLIIFASALGSQPSPARTERMLAVLGNVTFLDRPVRVATLVTAMKAALRARNRQYTARQTLISLEVQEEAARKRADFEQQLIGIVSHDLRNPLNVIALSAAALLRGNQPLPDKAKTAANRIAAATDRATRMVHDLLDFTRARLGTGIPIQRASLNLHALTRNAVQELALAHPGREVRVEAAGDGWGEWDADRLRQVLSNLVNNAIAYSPEGTPVVISMRGDARELVLAVHNAGAPIPAERQRQIFQPMQRLVVGESNNAGRSIGLGLYIVEHIVSAHGGTIEVASTEEAGTTFTVRLPRQAGAACA